ncbi:MAG: transglutaminase-like domain-containing protein [Planctomycetia bacterium]|nr:transglutaminase-like domain-containing protein [Planctomycetia bacterium]
MLAADRPARAADAQITAALNQAGDNRPEIQAALDKVPADERAGMTFLVANMPQQDLQSLKAQYLLDNVNLAYKAWRQVPWKDRVPQDVFLNYVLPYSSINERRDNWRKDFYDRFQPLVAGITSPGLAGAKLNEKIFPLLKVRYSRDRAKADQSPYESIASGKASCTGLAVLLVDACRAVGVPARFVGAPLWSDMSGNHSWVEIWDQGDWHFTGAAESTGDKLDNAWFVGRASQAKRDDFLHAIYAARFERSPQRFPLVWAQDDDYVYAVNVTDRYTRQTTPLPAGQTRIRFQVLDTAGGHRVPATLKLTDETGKTIAEGTTRDERFDGNDHLEAVAKLGGKYTVEIGLMDRLLTRPIEVKKNEELFTFAISDAQRRPPKRLVLTAAETTFIKSPEGQKLAAELKAYFAARPEKRADVKLSPEFDPLVLTQSAAVRKLAWAAYCQGFEAHALLADLKENRVKYKEYTSPFVVRAVGKMPAAGWPLFIAMHGGGGAPQELNDSQWRQMQIYYRDQPQLEGYLYLAIRAPNNTWNGFYDWYNLGLTENVIRQLVIAGGVDPNKVFLMGYSHGGYGAFFIGPQMADRFAAVHASAAAPATGNEVGKNLRHTPFTYMVGEHDTMYGRLSRCQAFDKYMHDVRGDRKDIYPVTLQYIAGAQHGGLPDRNKIKDMYAAVRDPVPRDVTWSTSYDNVKSFFWLHVPKPGGGKVVDADCRDNRLSIKGEHLDEVDVYLDPRLADFAKPLSIDAAGEKSTVTLKPSLRTLCETLAERGDPELMFATMVKLQFKQPTPTKK